MGERHHQKYTAQNENNNKNKHKQYVYVKFSYSYREFSLFLFVVVNCCTISAIWNEVYEDGRGRHVRTRFVAEID